MLARARNTVIFADPYKKCLDCRGWIDGYIEEPGSGRVVPCGHRGGYRDVCPSWSPVDGCCCAAYNVRHPTSPIVHEIRHPPADDDRIYGPAPLNHFQPHPYPRPRLRVDVA